MPTLIANVTPQVSEPALAKSEVDFPQVGPLCGTNLCFAGWFVLQGAPPQVRVEVVLKEFNNKTLSKGVAVERPDVAASIEVEPGSASYGYELRLHRYDLPPSFNLEVWAYFEANGEAYGVVVCAVAGTNVADEYMNGPQLSPLYVIGLGRSGTTALMRMLSVHPEIICGSNYPLELCISTYHAKNAKIVASIANHEIFSTPQIFSGPLSGPNPFASLEYVDRFVLDEILDRTNRLGVAHAIQLNEIWYRTLASRDNKRLPKYFAEKSVPEIIVTALNMYPRAVGIATP